MYSMKKYRMSFLLDATSFLHTAPSPFSDPKHKNTRLRQLCRTVYIPFVREVPPPWLSRISIVCLMPREGAVNGSLMSSLQEANCAAALLW